MQRLVVQNYSQNIYRNNQSQNQPTFTNNSKFGDLLTQGLQKCDKHAMIGVAVIDLLSMIIPRTIIDATRNGFAATETFIRESSGLLINCMLPGLVVMGAASLANNRIMKNKEFSKNPLHKVWTDQNSAEALRDKYKLAYKNNSDSLDKKVESYVRNVIDDIQGLDGKDWKNVKNLENKEKYIKEIKDIILSPEMKTKEGAKKLSKKLNGISEKMALELGAAKNIRLASITDSKKQITSTLSEKLRDTVDMGRIFTNKTININNIDQFVNKFSKLVKHKSIIGMGIMAGVGFSVQAINRYITKKRSGVDGFVGYKNYKKGKKRENTPEEKRELGFKKLLASAGMMGMAVASMGKINGGNVFQFKSIFPSMAQCRIISASTYTGRLAASDDENELRESFLRDTIGFLNLYVLGDYVAKGIATLLDKGKGQLVNTKKVLDKDAGAGKHFVNWIKNVELKGFEEISDKRLKNKRSIAQASGLVYAMFVLGILVPIFNKKMTEKKEIQEIKAEESKIKNNVEYPPSMTGSDNIKPSTKQLFAVFLNN